MRRSAGDPVGEFEELRRLLLSRERAQLRELEDRIADKERRSQDVAGVLPEAVKLSGEHGEELAHALRPAVEGSVRESIATKPETFVEALHPIIGPMVRRSIAESLRRLIQSLNQSLEHTFSWRGLKWRFEALRTGKSFGEVVMLRSLVYRVEQVFLIHRETSLSLLHVAADLAVTRDSDMVAGMLSAIQDFTKDSFQVSEGAGLEEFRVGEWQVWIAPGRDAYIAAVIRGDPPRELRGTLEEAIESIHVLKGSRLATFDGDNSVFESLRPELEACLRSQYSAEKKGGGQQIRAWLVLTILAALVVAAILMVMRGKAQWRNFVRTLGEQPGIVVTEAKKRWFAPSLVTGMRDRSSADPAAIAREAGINPKRVRFDWKDYQALDPKSVGQRVENRFGVPGGAQVSVKDGTLVLGGSIPYEWFDQVRREATLIPGVTSISESGANIVYDPKLAEKRFEEQLGLPETVNAKVTNGILTLSGEASHRWLTRVREVANKLPGITALDDGAVIDLDERAFAQSKSIIENAFVYFLINKDNIATEGFTALSRLPDELRRCESAAGRIGSSLTLEIRGYADSVGDDAKNRDLSQRRATKVYDFLLSCGFDSAMLRPMGIGAPPKPTDGQSLPDEAERRVAFKIISRPSTPP